MNDVIHAFPDTNVFLHYKPLAQIDWCGLVKSRSVKMVVCLPVIQELDVKKSDPRLADRARRAIKDIDEQCTESKPLRDGVTLEIYGEEVRRGEFPPSQNPDSQDDRIIHLVKKYAASHPDRTVCILTEDLGMKVKCRAVGLRFHQPGESDRLENPGDERDKKLKQLQGELASLKNRLPKLSLGIFPPEQASGEAKQFHWKLSDDWIDLDAKAEVEKLRMNFRKRAARPSSLLRMPVAKLLEASISPQQWEQYNAQLDSYFANYEIYVDRLNTWGSNNALTISFGCVLENTGTSPATDIDVSLGFPSKIRWLAERSSSEASLLQKPNPPSPPKPPKPSLYAASFLSQEFGGLLGLPGPILENLARRPDPREPAVDVVLRPTGGHVIHVKLDRLKHGKRVNLGTFIAMFGSWADMSPFEIECTVSTSEHSSKIAGKVPLIVSKAGDLPGRNSDEAEAADDLAGS